MRQHLTRVSGAKTVHPPYSRRIPGGGTFGQVGEVCEARFHLQNHWRFWTRTVEGGLGLVHRKTYFQQIVWDPCSILGIYLWKYALILQLGIHLP